MKKPRRTSTGDWGLPKPDWKRRRRLLYLALAFCAGWISWVLYKGTDSVLFQNALYVLGGGAVALIGQYVFGAAYDDKNYMESISNMRSNGVSSSTTMSDDEDDDKTRPLSGGQ